MVKEVKNEHTFCSCMFSHSHMQGSIAILASHVWIEYIRRNNLTLENGEPLSYVMKECWQSLYYVGWGLQVISKNILRGY